MLRSGSSRKLPLDAVPLRRQAAADGHDRWSARNNRLAMRSLAMSMRLLLALFGLVLLPHPASAQAQAQAHETAPAVTTARRVALVIGNNGYESAPLSNSINDARAMAGVLREAGFAVMLLTDVDQRQFQLALREFGERLKASGSGGAGLFYYAGHGMQIKGRNFLIPVRSHIAHEDEVAYSAVDAQSVLDKMESAGNGTNIVILDACRNNPFARSMRSGQQGLAQMDAPVGTLVAYATAPGAVAIDTLPGLHNGLYTTHLLDAMRRPGLKVEDVLKQTRNAVLRASGNRQMPWEASALVGDFYFHPPQGGQAAAPAAGTPAAPAPTPAVDLQAALDDAFWAAVRDSRSSAELFAYLNRFPSGRNAREARRRLLDLAQAQTPSPSSPATAPAEAAADPAAAVRESSERLRAELLAARGAAQELNAWADLGANPRSEHPARNAAGFSEGDRWRYLVTDLRGRQGMRSYVWRIDRVDADGALWVNGGRQRLDAQGQRHAGNDEDSGVWLDFQPPLPVAQLAAGGPGGRGDFATVVQERDAGGNVLRHVLRGTWQTQADPINGPRGITHSLTALRVEFRLDGHTEYPGGRRADAQWVHRYWLLDSVRLPLHMELEEREGGALRRHSLHELVAVDMLGAH